MTTLGFFLLRVATIAAGMASTIALVAQVGLATAAISFDISLDIPAVEPAIVERSLDDTPALEFSLPPTPTQNGAIGHTNDTTTTDFTQRGSTSPLKPPPVAAVPDRWWSEGSDSPIAVALGAAEGTRHTDGSKHPAFYWHTDPGNGANNFGTFSWQHLPPEAMQPVVQAATVADKRAVSAQLGLAEQADRAAFARIERFHDQIRDQAAAQGMRLTFSELLNGLDLANQSPQAAFSSMGYLDRLAQMQRTHSDPHMQILEARVWAYWHPDYNRWDAPGLGNTYTTIRADQARRMDAIATALQTYAPNTLEVVSSSGRLAAVPQIDSASATPATPVSSASPQSPNYSLNHSPASLNFQPQSQLLQREQPSQPIAPRCRTRMSSVSAAIDFSPCPPRRDR